MIDLWLINNKCNGIMQGFLAQNHEQYCKLAEDKEEADCAMRQLETMHCNLKEQFKE